MLLLMIVEGAVVSKITVVSVVNEMVVIVAVVLVVVVTPVGLVIRWLSKLRWKRKRRR